MMMAEWWFVILSKVGGVGAIAWGAWAAFKTFSAKWLENKFAEKLKKLEQQHDVVIRHVQSTIDREFQRALKLHGKEFDTLAHAGTYR